MRTCVGKCANARRVTVLFDAYPPPDHLLLAVSKTSERPGQADPNDKNQRWGYERQLGGSDYQLLGRLGVYHVRVLERLCERKASISLCDICVFCDPSVAVLLRFWAESWEGLSPPSPIRRFTRMLARTSSALAEC
jgi:hypothetical protein